MIILDLGEWECGYISSLAPTTSIQPTRLLNEILGHFTFSGLYVLLVCVPCVGKIEAIHKIKKLTYFFFLCTGFILSSS